jgi:hypothetical protein
VQPPRTDDRAAQPAHRRPAWVVAVGLVLVVASLTVAVTFETRPVPLVTSNFTNVIATFGEMAAALVLAAWVALAVIRRRRVALGPAPIVVAATVLLVAAWASVPGAIDPSLAAWNAVRLSVAVGLAVVVANEVGPRELTLAAVAVIAIHAAVGIGQVVMQQSVGLAWLGERDFAPGVTGASTVTSVDGAVLLRAYGLAGSPNILGGVLAAAIALLAAVPVRWLAARAAVTAAIALGALALVVTFSRSAWIGLGAGLVVLLLLATRGGDRQAVRRWTVSVVAVSLAVAALVPSVAPFLAARATAPSSIHNETRSIEERLALNEQTVAVLRERPLTGTGIGELPLAIATAFPDSRYGRAPAHLVPLTVAAEIGVVGGLAWLGLLAAPWVLLASASRAWTRDLAIASAALAVFAAVGFFDYYPWGSPIGRLWWWVLVGLWAGAWRAAMPLRPPGAAAGAA